jgi:hypothetical protein
MKGANADRSEEGTVLLLILGLVVIAALFVTVVMDVSALFIDRRELIAAADGAALAGAQAVDEESLYTKGLPAAGPLTLDEERARAAVRSYLQVNGLFNQYQNLRLEIVTTSTTVSVRLGALVELPVVNSVTPGAGDGVRVEAMATAETAVIG